MEKITKAISVGIFILFLIFTFWPIKIPVSLNGTFNENRLLVGVGGNVPNTGSMCSIIKGNEALSEYFSNKKDININRATLTGDTPLNYIDVNALASKELQFIVEGKIVSTKEGSPIFYVDNCQAVSYIPYIYYGKLNILISCIWIVLGGVVIYQVLYVIWYVFTKYASMKKKK